MTIEKWTLRRRGIMVVCYKTSQMVTSMLWLDRYLWMGSVTTGIMASIYWFAMIVMMFRLEGRRSDGRKALRRR
jgi:hypothetical protein